MDIVNTVVVRACTSGATDIHLIADRPPLIKSAGKFMPIPPGQWEQDRVVSATELRIWWREVNSEVGHDGRVMLRGLPFRVECSSEGAEIHLRRIGTTAPLDMLGYCSKLIDTFEKISRGLVLLSGGPGSGRTTSAASFLFHLVRNRTTRAITYGKKIEVLIPADGASQVTQLSDSHSINGVPIEGCLERVIEHALAIGAEILFVDEIRTGKDLQSIVSAVEQGVLVIASYRCAGGICPMLNSLRILIQQGERKEFWYRFLAVLKLALWQSLLSDQRNSTLVMAYEAISQDKDAKFFDANHELVYDLHSVPISPPNLFSSQYDQNLVSLYKQSHISREEALRAAHHPETLAKILT